MTGNSAITAAINVFDKGLGLTGEAWLETEDHTCIWNGSIKPESKEADIYLPFFGRQAPGTRICPRQSGHDNTILAG